MTAEKSRNAGDQELPIDIRFLEALVEEHKNDPVILELQKQMKDRSSPLMYNRVWCQTDYLQEEK